MPEIKPLSPEIKKRVLQMQQNELTEYHIYTKVAGFVKNPENKATLLKIANEEHRHYQIWETFTKEKVQPIQWKVWWYTFLSVIFGYTFALKLMEGNEGDAAYNYEDIAAEIPQAQKIAEDEERHEQKLLASRKQKSSIHSGYLLSARCAGRADRYFGRADFSAAEYQADRVIGADHRGFGNFVDGFV